MLSLFTVAAALFGVQDGATTTVPLKDGYVRLVSETYSVELPSDWAVSDVTWYGQRSAKPKAEKGELGIMTAPPSRQSWDDLYETALYFIQREESGKATPYRLTKTKRGYEAAAFEVMDKEGFAKRRFVMVKDPEKGLLALSVTIPGKDAEKAYAKHFQRLVDSARFLEG